MNIDTHPEFIFQLTNNSTPPDISNEVNSIVSTVIKGVDSTKSIPMGWVLHPEGVSQFSPYEWARARVSDKDPFSEPFLWNRYSIEIEDV